MFGQIFHRNKFLYLLTALLVFLIFNPIFVDNEQEMLYFGILFTIVILFSVYIIQNSRILLILTTTLAAFVIIGFWIIELYDTNPSIGVAEYACTIVFFFLITGIVLKSVIVDSFVNLNTLCGAICGYILIGLVWAYAYILLYHLNHQAFSIPKYDALNLKLPSQFFTYYSFTTQSTLGLGDVVPVTRVAKMLSWLQAVVGQIYLTVWIAQLVGLHIVNKVNRGKSV